MPTTCHCFSSSSLSSHFSHTAPISYQHAVQTGSHRVCKYLQMHIQSHLKTYSEPFHSLLLYTIHSSSSSHTCHPSSAPTVAARLLFLLSTGTFPLPLHLPTFSPPTPSHFLSPYTLPLPLPPNSHVVVSVSSSLFCSPQLRADRWSHLCRTA